MIDFGLGFFQGSFEDMAVDLYVMERAFESTHPNSEALVHVVLQTYKERCRYGDRVLGRLAQVRARGRKRDMLG